MGKAKKTQPARLPAKLLTIRKFLDFSQEEMVKFVVPDVEDAASARAAISDYEAGRRTPSILENLNYAVAVRLLTRHKNFNVEDLIDDRRNLPFALRSQKGNPEQRREDEIPLQRSVVHLGALPNKLMPEESTNRTIDGEKRDR